MSLKEFYESIAGVREELWSDKGKEHDYINSYYDKLFSPLKDENIKILEIGIYKGQSTRLFREYFTNAEIYTIDNGGEGGGIFSIEGVNHYWLDGYSSNTLDLFKNDFFDFIIDDGPHTYDSQLYSVQHWYNKLKIGGRLIIEDVKGLDWCDGFKLIRKGNIYDFREHKNRFDDIIYEVIK